MSAARPKAATGWARAGSAKSASAANPRASPTALTGADVAYSINLAMKNSADPYSTNVATVASATASGNTVTVTFKGTPGYTEFTDYLWRAPVLPEAVTDIPVDLAGKVVVLVDDVLFTGRTIRAAMNGLFDLGRPKRVSLCVLIDRGHREMPIEAQYVGRNVQTSDSEIIEVRLQEIDNEERVVLVDRVEG